jgi:hypothetical protein
MKENITEDRWWQSQLEPKSAEQTPSVGNRERQKVQRVSLAHGPNPGARAVGDETDKRENSSTHHEDQVDALCSTGQDKSRPRELKQKMQLGIKTQEVSREELTTKAKNDEGRPRTEPKQKSPFRSRKRAKQNELRHNHENHKTCSINLNMIHI